MGARKGFTLIELLVVIAIIAILTSILFPVLVKTKEAARETKCSQSMKQIGIAMLAYAQDYNEQFSHVDYTYAGTFGNMVMNPEDYGKWYWPFVLRPYLGARYPTDLSSKPSDCIFCCPSAYNSGKSVYMIFTKNNQVYPLYYGGLAKKWGLKYQQIPAQGARAGGMGYAFYLSYSINEHIPWDSWMLSKWQHPTKSFMIVEGQDTEINGSVELADKLLYDTHNGGFEALYIDGHVKWHKSVYSGSPSSSNINVRQAVKWVFPPGCGKTADNDIFKPASQGGDSGPWTATASDDY